MKDSIIYIIIILILLLGSFYSGAQWEKTHDKVAIPMHQSVSETPIGPNKTATTQETYQVDTPDAKGTVTVTDRDVLLPSASGTPGEHTLRKAQTVEFDLKFKKKQNNIYLIGQSAGYSREIYGGLSLALGAHYEQGKITPEIGIIYSF